MGDKGKQDFRFYPRPEAHSMDWGQLLPPLSRAVRELLVRLDGAITQVEQIRTGSSDGNPNQVVSNCFLVYGERGTGKTTVLLSTKNAVDKPDDSYFYVGDKTNEPGLQKALLEDAKNKATSLKKKGIIWLDVLDMEPLPRRANPLTTMLTYVRNSLCASGSDKPSSERTSILEEAADSARNKLDLLINDATLMWEGVREPDTRSMANKQVAAADIYAQFRKRFQNAMETLSKELGRRSGSDIKYCPIVLPIDNIDRSTDHLYNIVKLAQMVASPYLWLVMAGDREDVETFLERAYWKELISIGEGAGGAGKEGLTGEDEALLMARRQAAAASHKLLPPSHRVEVEPVAPEDTLKFCPYPKGKSGHSDKQRLDELLKDVGFDNYGNGPNAITLVELFNARKRVEDTKKISLTRAAWFALRLPARGVLDLWQLAYWGCNDDVSKYSKDSGNKKGKAAKIVRTMLRNCITESSISSKLGKFLQERIIHREPNSATMLDFSDGSYQSKIYFQRTRDLRYRINYSQDDNEQKQVCAVRAVITVNENKEQPVFLFTRAGLKEKGEPEPEIPHLVSGWLTVLHDILSWSDLSGVVDSPVSLVGDELDINLVCVAHEVICTNCQQKRIRQEVSVSWPTPKWGTFFEYDVFQMRWDKFRESSGTTGNSRSILSVFSTDCLPWGLALVWVACVIDTFWALLPENCKIKQEKAPRPSATELTTKIMKPSTCSEEEAIKNEKEATKKEKEPIEKFEQEVTKRAADLYSEIMDQQSNDERVFLNSEGIEFMKDWLEKDLPLLLLSHWYVPSSEKTARIRWGKDSHWFSSSDNPNFPLLRGAWRRNASFIEADLAGDIAKLFAGKEPSEKTAPMTIDITAQDEFKKILLAPFSKIIGGMGCEGD